MNQTDMAENTGEGSASEPQKSFIIRVREEAKAITGNKKLTKLFQDLGKEAIKQVPLVGGMVTTADKIFHGLAEIEDTERQQRLKDYVIGILENYQEDVEFRTEDVLPVIRKLATDDEASKTKYYTRLSINLGRMDVSRFPTDIRYYFIRMVSELTCFQIEYAREFYIRDTIPLCGYPDCKSAVTEFLCENTGPHLHARRHLVNWGLLEEKSSALLSGGTRTDYSRTEDLNLLMEYLFRPYELLPDVIGRTGKAVFDVIIINNLELGDLFPTALRERLERAGLTVGMTDRVSDHQHQMVARRYVWNCLTSQYPHGQEQKIVEFTVLDAPLPPDGGFPDSTRTGRFPLNPRAGSTANWRYWTQEELQNILEMIADGLIAELQV